MTRRRSHSPFFLIFLILVCSGLIAGAAYTPVLAGQSFGPPSKNVTGLQRFTDAIDLLWNTGYLTVPSNTAGAEQDFTIGQGESVLSISSRLQKAGLIHDAATFRRYLVWTGADTTIQTGTYRLSPAMTAIDIARKVQSATLTEIPFDILPGWRMEEIAAALPTSGLSITLQDFLSAAALPVNPPFYLSPGASGEGFFFPDQYVLPRSTTAAQLVAAMLQDFSDHLTPDLRNGFVGQGLTIYQAVILASIVQRETMTDAEMPVIASVFYNRLSAGMKLESDPTVQYALGFNPTQLTWWTNPLSLDDLKDDSPYNTYLYPGLPPSPISNPGLTALQAVANPARTNYLYFRARCDGSGLHNFSETFTQHLANSCP